MADKPEIKKLTHAEHDARAMLLGRVYDWRDGTYCLKGDTDCGCISMGMLDAMTLEPMDDHNCTRMQMWGNTKNVINPAFGRLETPYAYSEQE